jgi:hypothetical protein
MPTRLLGLRLLMSAVRALMRRLLPRLGNMGRALREVLPVFLLFVNNFLIVRYVSWIGHVPSLDDISNIAPFVFGYHATASFQFR